MRRAPCPSLVVNITCTARRACGPCRAHIGAIVSLDSTVAVTTYVSLRLPPSILPSLPLSLYVVYEASPRRRWIVSISARCCAACRAPVLSPVVTPPRHVLAPPPPALALPAARRLSVTPHRGGWCPGVVGADSGRSATARRRRAYPPFGTVGECACYFGGVRVSHVRFLWRACLSSAVAMVACRALACLSARTRHTSCASASRRACVRCGGTALFVDARQCGRGGRSPHRASVTSRSVSARPRVVPASLWPGGIHVLHREPPVATPSGRPSRNDSATDTQPGRWGQPHGVEKRSGCLAGGSMQYTLSNGIPDGGKEGRVAHPRNVE